VYLVAYPASSFFASCRSCLPQSAHWLRTIRHPIAATQLHLTHSEFVDNVHILSTASSYHSTAVLRDISTGTSYQIVRLVFRPYTHLSSANWTSARLISSIRISPDFNTNRYSSLSFGSYRYNYSISLGSRLLILHLAIPEISLVRVSIRVLSNRLKLMYFQSFILSNYFQLSLAVLLCYRSPHHI
jgi:hypothetical protein